MHDLFSVTNHNSKFVNVTCYFELQPHDMQLSDAIYL